MRSINLKKNVPHEKDVPTFPGSSNGKESACNVGDLGSIPGLGRLLGEGKGYPLQYSGLEKSIGCVVHGTTKSQTGLSDFSPTIAFTWWYYIELGVLQIKASIIE